MRRITSIIGGRALSTNGAHEIPIINPHDESQNGTLFEADAAEVDAAVTAARSAFDEGPWPRMEVGERQALLREAGAKLAAHGDELAQLECEDAGLPMHEIRGRHVPRMQQNFEYVASILGFDTGDTLEQIPNYLTPVMLELGGKSANLVFESADIDAAIDGALLGIYSNNGQQCPAGSRVFVQRSILDTFIERFAARSRNIRVGDPRNPDTEIGPLCFREHYERVLGYVDIAVREGGTPVCGGRRAAGFDAGYYVEPTAFLVADNDARIAQEEIFGPFATIIPFDCADDGIRMANDSDFGLVAYAWTEDLKTALQARSELRAGTVWINTPLMRDLHAPFGGYKHSGIGRAGGFEGIHFFTETKTTTIATTAMNFRKLGDR